jgi:oligosaccharide repeat unit polymerase
MQPQVYKEIYFLNLFISLFLIIQILLFFIIPPNQLYIDILKYEILLFFIWCFISMYKRLKLTSLYFLFLFSFGLFILSRIFLDILGLCKFEYANMFFDTYFSLETQKNLLGYILFILISVNFGALNFIKSGNNKNEILDIIQPNKSVGKIGIFLFILIFPIILAKNYIQFSFVLAHGYLSIFSGEMDKINYPLYMTGASSIFDISIMLILVSKPNKKLFLIVAIFYLFVQLINSFTGGRGRFILSILFIIWYYYKVYDLKIKIRSIVYFLIFIILFSQTISALRSNQDISLNKNPLYSFFYEQGTSILVLGHMVNSKDKFVNTGAPYILAGLNFNTGSNTIKHLKETNSLASELTYFLSPQSYLNGYGIGSSFLGELYDLGILGTLIITCLLGGFIVWFDANIMNKPSLFFFSMLIVQQILWMPRGSLLPEYKRIIVFLIAFLILQVLKKKKKILVIPE